MVIAVVGWEKKKTWAPGYGLWFVSDIGPSQKLVIAAYIEKPFVFPTFVRCEKLLLIEKIWGSSFQSETLLKLNSSEYPTTVV